MNGFVMLLIRGTTSPSMMGRFSSWCLIISTALPLNWMAVPSGGASTMCCGVLHGGLADLDPLADAHVGVLPREAVDADHLLAPVLLFGAPDLRDRGALALDLDDVARARASAPAGC